MRLACPRRVDGDIEVHPFLVGNAVGGGLSGDGRVSGGHNRVVPATGKASGEHQGDSEKTEEV